MLNGRTQNNAKHTTTLAGYRKISETCSIKADISEVVGTVKYAASNWVEATITMQDTEAPCTRQFQLQQKWADFYPTTTWNSLTVSSVLLPTNILI